MSEGENPNPINEKQLREQSRHHISHKKTRGVFGWRAPHPLGADFLDKLGLLDKPGEKKQSPPPKEKKESSTTT